jgi:hypothetical protein
MRLEVERLEVERLEVERLEVERLPRPTTEPEPLWFWWSGPCPLSLAELWQAYVARFAIEHTFRCFKQPRTWTTPKLRAPEAADRWTWLLLLAYVQLRLARDHGHPLTLAGAIATRTPYTGTSAPRLFAPAGAPGYAR